MVAAEAREEEEDEGEDEAGPPSKGSRISKAKARSTPLSR